MKLSIQVVRGGRPCCVRGRSSSSLEIQAWLSKVRIPAIKQWEPGGGQGSQGTAQLPSPPPGLVMKSQESHSCSVLSVFSPPMLLGKSTNISCENLHGTGRGRMLFSKESKEPRHRPKVPEESASQTPAPRGAAPQHSSRAVEFYRQHGLVLLSGCFQCRLPHSHQNSVTLLLTGGGRGGR